MSRVYYAPIDSLEARVWVNGEIPYQLIGEVIVVEDKEEYPFYQRIAFQGYLPEDNPSVPVQRFFFNGPLSREAGDENVFAFSLAYRSADEDSQHGRTVEDIIWCRLNRYDPNQGVLWLDSISKNDTAGFIETIALELDVAESLTELESQPSPPAGYYYSPVYCNWRLFLHFEGQELLPHRAELIDFQIEGANFVWAHPGGIVSEVAPDGTPGQKVILSDQFQNDGGGHFDPGASEITLNVDVAQQNRYLLAHELGHLFGLCHPTEPKNGYIQGDSCGVMVPSRPMFRRNSVGQLQTVHLGSHRKVAYPHIVSVNNSDTSVMLNSSDPFIDNPTVPFYIPNFYYDDGRPLNIVPNLLASLPDPQALVFLQAESDVDWWGWNSGLWNRPETAADALYADSMGHRHTDPVDGDNVLHIQLNICAELDEFLPRIFLFKGQFANNQMTISPLNIIDPDDQPKNNLVVNLPNPYRFGQAVFESIRWRIQPGQWAVGTWLVAVTWNYRISTDSLAPLAQAAPLSISAATPQGRFNQVRTFENTVTQLLGQATHTFDMDNFAAWIAQNRCVAVRRPGNPRSPVSQPA